MTTYVSAAVLIYWLTLVRFLRILTAGLLVEILAMLPKTALLPLTIEALVPYIKFPLNVWALSTDIEPTFVYWLIS